jgi:hypothetical protein
LNADQHVSDVTFVFTPHTSSADFDVNVKDATIVKKPGAHFTTFHKTVVGDIAGGGHLLLTRHPLILADLPFAVGGTHDAPLP